MCFIITSYFIPRAPELMCYNMNDVVKALLTLVPTCRARASYTHTALNALMENHINKYRSV